MPVETETDLMRQLHTLQQRVLELESERSQRRDDDRRESQELFRVMADASPVMMWMSGTDALCTFFNKLWLSFRGRGMEQELGNGWAEGVHPEDAPACMEAYLKAFEARQPFQLQYRLRRGDGEYRWILDSGVPLFSPENVFEGYIGSGVDIHDWKLATTPGPAVKVPLTEREKQVLVLIAEGRSTKELAAELGISYKTADSHRSKIMEKLDIHETATLVRYAVRHNLVKP